MSPLFEQLIHTGIDWITATTTTTDGRERYDYFGRKWLEEEARSGNDCVEWMGHGYSGLRCGSVQYGRYNDSSLLRVTGLDADVKARPVIAFSTNVSRLDFQSTVRMVQPHETLASKFERKARSFKGKHKKAFEVELRRNDLRGQTLYLGRRQSERFIRIYNKHAESKHPFYERCWRAEVQYSGALAKLRAAQFLDSPADSLLCHETVRLELARRGIPWAHLPKRSRHVLKGVPNTVPTTDERRLQWLRSQVRPTIEVLLDHGRLSEVLSALSLDEEISGGHKDAATGGLQCE